MAFRFVTALAVLGAAIIGAPGAIAASTQPFGSADPQVPPPGYDGTKPPPPPRGWDGDDQADPAQADHYADSAERWARANCVKHGDGAAAANASGTVIGAAAGSAASGWRDRASGTLAGAAVGAIAGATAADGSATETSPGCPPGYVVRDHATVFVYSGEPDFVYAAPDWYLPWVFVGTRWIYRPYPYYRFWVRRYWRHPWRPHPGWYRRTGWGHPRGWRRHHIAHPGRVHRG